MQRKVEQLQHNVQEWKDSYDLLMNELRKLKLEKIIEREELVKEVKVLHTDAKVCINGHSRVCFILLIVYRICSKLFVG